jgi:hypothetical protein
MSQLATFVAYLALAGALVSWIIGAWLYARTLRAVEVERGSKGAATWLAVVVWPLARGRLDDAAAAHASKVNKALVAFLACVMVAAAATSVATNLARVSR